MKASDAGVASGSEKLYAFFDPKPQPRAIAAQLRNRAATLRSEARKKAEELLAQLLKEEKNLQDESYIKLNFVYDDIDRIELDDTKKYSADGNDFSNDCSNIFEYK